MRSLNHIEQAFTYSNEVNPLCVAIVLRMRRAPTAVKLREALDELQRRHILLRHIIVGDREKYAFQEMETVAPIPLRRVHRRGPSHWEEATEKELNTRFDASGSLIRTVHLLDDSDESELILVLHHAVMDGISARLILHELLHLLSEFKVPNEVSRENIDMRKDLIETNCCLSVGIGGRLDVMVNSDIQTVFGSPPLAVGVYATGTFDAGFTLIPYETIGIDKGSGFQDDPDVTGHKMGHALHHARSPITFSLGTRGTLSTNLKFL